jgi:hypothetical protein
MTKDEGPSTIYDLSGRRIQGEWKDLPRGLYIVNGQKTMKR